MRRWFGGLIVVVLVSWLVTSPACTPEPPTSVPGDLEIHYSWGACHAEWGRYELTINSSGEANFVKSFGNPMVAGYLREQSEFNLSDEELLGIYREIITNNFFGLGGSYLDRSIMNGNCSSLRVKAEGEEHEVFVSNKRVERFDRITAAITAILDSKVVNWEDLREQTGEEKPEGTMTVAELLENPVYDTEVRIYGRVAGLVEFDWQFTLTSGGKSVMVWYDEMVENDGTLRPPVNVVGINNGDKIVVTGELKGEGGTHYSEGDFWATEVSVKS